MGSGERGLKRLIVTADDFGVSLPVNEAIEAGHLRGILTAASLMVGAPMAADAVERAKRMPRLGVGLHVVVTRGRAVSSPRTIPDLVDGDGRFDDNLVRAGFRYFFLPAARRQLAVEIRAQFNAFRRFDLPFDHVNVHNHLHMHPTVLGLILRIGREYGVGAIRVPYEPADRADTVPQRALNWLLRIGWVVPMKSRIRRAGLRHNDFIFGLRDTGRLNRTRLLGVLSRLPDGLSEVFCHPAVSRWEGTDPAAAHFAFEEELNALLDGDVRRYVDQSHIALSNYRAVAW